MEFLAGMVVGILVGTVVALWFRPVALRCPKCNRPLLVSGLNIVNEGEPRVLHHHDCLYLRPKVSPH